MSNHPYSGSGGPGGIQWWDPNTFAQPANGTFGNCGNGTVRGPGLTNLDLSVQKEFLFTENKRLQFRTDFINFTNTPILNAPNLTGDATNGFGVVTGSQGARQIQLALKFLF